MTKDESIATRATINAAQKDSGAIDGVEDTMKYLNRVRSTFVTLRKNPETAEYSEYVS